MLPDQPVYRVLIVEDDFRIAHIQQELLELDHRFEVVASCRNGTQALAWLCDHPQGADLVFLDVYLPDVEGLSLLWEIRRYYRQLDIVMMTAAKEVDTVEEALRAGVFDFLIKPVQADRLRHMLDRFVNRRRLSSEQRELNQELLDHALGNSSASLGFQKRVLPKGVDALSLQTILEALHKAQAPLTASDLALQTGTSRSTARRYLEYLVGTGDAQVEQVYGEVGRPQRLYRKA